MKMIRHRYSNHPLRQELVQTALEWEERFGVMPGITGIVAEFDAAMLVGHTPKTFSLEMQGTTAVRKGVDFHYKKRRYQIKGNRPSDKPGAKVTLVSKTKNYDWDVLIWVLYNKSFDIEECWQWSVEKYRDQFDNQKRLGPKDMRLGKSLG